MPDILTKSDQKHVLITPTTCRCDKRSDSPCAICDGGLAVCSLCGAAEIELDGPCVPKQPYKENGLPTLETIRISLPGLTTAETDRLRRIQKEVAERPSDENAMESACGEYNCPCHYQIGFLLEVIAKTMTVSLPALRATLFSVIDTEEWRFYNWNWANSDTADEEATEHRVKFADAVCDRLCQLPARG